MIIINWLADIEFVIFRIAAAVPVLVLWIEYNVRKLRAMTIVFMLPTRNKKDFGFVSVISEARKAACPEPMPGRNEEMGAVIAAARLVFNVWDNGRNIELVGERICLGIFVLFFIDISKADEPNSPDSKGRRG